MYLPNRTCLGLLVPYQGTVCELGVAKGAFSDALLRKHPHIKKIIGVDKWNDDRHPSTEYDLAIQRLAVHTGRVELIRATFEEALPLVDNFDLVYVDGYAHTGQDGGTTLDMWWPKVKVGGVFAGHDYDPKWPLTIHAVNNFAAKNKLSVSIIQDTPFNSWWVRKLG